MRSPVMEAEIWSQLPTHLLDLILAHLPPRRLLAFRSTCKYFNSLLSNPSFLSLVKLDPPVFSPFLLLSHPQLPRHTFALCQPFLDRWRTLVLPLPYWLLVSSPLNLAASSNGLLCFSTANYFILANFITSSLKTINFPNHSSTSVVITPSSRDGYKLISISDLSVSVYDSKAGDWRVFDGYNRMLYHEGAFSEGRIYFTTREPFSVVNFHPGTGDWIEESAQMPEDLTFGRLVGSDGGRIFLIGGIGRDGISRSLNIWELDDDRRHWQQLVTLPELMRRKFVSACYHNYDHVYCFWHDGLICVCCYTWPEILAYKISRRAWHWLPKCPSLPEKWSCGFRWFSFSPNFNAIV